MTIDPTLAAWADAVLLPCFDGTATPDWVRRRVAGTLGGVCLFARNVADDESLRRLTESLHTERDGVVIAIDEEAGDVTRIDAAVGSRFPGAAALGRVDDVALTEVIAAQVGGVLADLGVTLNFAPCADVATDPANPVIGSRSFGPDVALVARHTAAWVSGQQTAGVAACAKHFPGHGDTDADTHLRMAVVDSSLEAVWAQAIPPFQAAIKAGTAAVMAGHLLVPAVDGVPASISRRWLTDILRGELGFTGVIVSDALEMAAVRDPFGIPGAAVRALAAGTDLLCIGGAPRPEEEIDAIRDAIVAAVASGALSGDRLAEAATRSAALGRLTPSEASQTSQRPSAGGGHAVDAADRALQVAGPLPRLATPVLVLRCAEPPNIAVGDIPWGPTTTLPAWTAPTELVMHDGDPLPEQAVAAAGSVLVVTRDRHRHGWMSALVDAVRRLRPDSVLVEMGISGVAAEDRPAVASYGASAANTAAVVRLLAAEAIRR